MQTFDLDGVKLCEYGAGGMCRSKMPRGCVATPGCLDSILRMLGWLGQVCTAVWHYHGA